MRELEGAADGGPGTMQRLRTGPWWPPAQDDLEALVEQCGVRSDIPPVLGLEPGQVGEAGERMGLRADEVAIVNDAIRRLHESFLRRLRPLYVEATGDEAGAQSLSADAMIAQINSAAAEGEVQDAHRQLALELAGRAEPPEDVAGLSPAAQALRLYDGLGAELQQLLGAELGADRARDLRAAAGGWPWGRSYSRTCE